MSHTQAKTAGLDIDFEFSDQYEYERPYIHGQHVVDRQVIITGKGDEIDEVVNMVNRSFMLELLELGSKNRKVMYDISVEGPLDPNPISVEKDIEIRLYDLKVENKRNGVRHRREELEEDVWKVIHEVYVQARELGVIVFADPNLITKNLTNGGSGSVSGGPGGPPGGDPDEDDFWNHWCFKSPGNGFYGINLENEYGIRKLEEGDNGESVDIIVFDTVDPDLAYDSRKSASVEKLPEVLTLRSKNRGKILLRYAHRPSGVKRCVRHNYGSHQPRESVAHGGFIAGLIQRVAPEADIHLLGVLDDHGRGDLYTLLKRLHKILGQAGNDGTGGVLLKKLVINFSLGVAISETAMLEEKVRNAIWDLYTKTQKPKDNREAMDILLEGMAKDFYYVPSLRLLIKKLTENGTVFVAAAGNDSGARYGRLPMQIPARYPEVIGVVSSGKAGQISCFSNDDIENEKKIKAPGGDADETFCRITDLDDKWEKIADNNKEKNSPDKKIDFSDFALISVVSQSKKSKGFAYWRGTSFSTALVSGLAALVIQKMDSKSVEEIASKVKEHIQNGLGERGVIDVKKTLAMVGNNTAVSAS